MTDFTFDFLDMKDLRKIHSMMKKDNKKCKTAWAQFLLCVNIAHQQETALFWIEPSTWSKKKTSNKMCSHL